MMAVFGIALAATLVQGDKAYAADLAPGEGLYVGGFIGHGMGVVSPKVTVIDLDNGGVQGTESLSLIHI